MTTPNKLKREFTELFEKQDAIESDPIFQSKKKKYENIKLESKYEIATLSEIFQDPDLLARISDESHSFIKLKERKTRVRPNLEILTNKKPQAKDVPANRIIEDEELERIKAAEESIDKQSEYINPVASKKRKYLTESKADVNDVVMNINNATSDQADSREQTETPVESNVTTPTNSINSNLALPAVCLPESSNNTGEAQQGEEEHPLEKSFRETALLVEQSPLKTVGSRYLYTLLPRQSDSNAYKYVKEDYTPHNIEYTEQQKDARNILDDTLIAITIFNPAKTNKKFQQVEILGSQKLTEFRDSIYCLSDFLSNGDRKNKEPDGEIINTSDKKLSPAIIYSDHVFYVDKRLDDNLDDYYHELIESWLTKKGVNKSVFRYDKKNMHDTLIEEMPFKLHHPIVFIHQEKCEHMLLVQDIRLLAPKEYKSKDEFPRTTHNLRYDRFKCSMCTIFPATKITTEEIYSGFSPCYYCERCFDAFHSENDSVNAIEYRGTAGGDLRKK